LIERIRRDELLGRDELGDRRGAQRTGESGESGRERGEQQQHDQVVVVDLGVDRESGARQSEDDRADDHQHAFVDAVAHRAAPERTGDEEG